MGQRAFQKTSAYKVGVKRVPRPKKMAVAAAAAAIAAAAPAVASKSPGGKLRMRRVEHYVHSAITLTAEELALVRIGVREAEEKGAFEAP
jgi:hypothetical protein